MAQHSNHNGAAMRRTPFSRFESNARRTVVKTWMAVFIVGFSTSVRAGAAIDDSTSVRIYGVRVLVSDMDEAVAFYSGTLGFPVRSVASYPDEVELRSAELRFFLNRTERSAQYDYSGTVRTTFGFQANDLLATQRLLAADGVTFVEPEPERVGVGIATTFKDPSGNVLYLLEQQVGDRTAFDEPRIYNVGFHLPDQAVARELYCGVLGFVVRTEKYLPAVPLGHPDGTFAFMLHEKSNLNPRTSSYPDEAQIVPLFEAQDLAGLAVALDEAGYMYGRRQESGTEVMTVYDSFGNVLEIRQARNRSTG